jgi:hypothetical protein
LGGRQWRARPQLGQSLAQMPQWLAELWGHRRLTGRRRTAFRGLLGLTEGPQCVLPGACACGRRRTVVRSDLLVAAPRHGGGRAGLTPLLLLGGLKTLALPLTLGEPRVERLERCGRNGVEKGLDDAGRNRGPVEMGTSGFGKRALHTHADVPRAGTGRHAHAVPTAATGRAPLQAGGARAGRSLPLVPLVGRALGLLMPARLLGQVWCPTHRGGRAILQDALPLAHWAVHHWRRPLSRGVAPGFACAPPINDSAGRGWGGEDGANRRFRGLTPADVAGAEVPAMASREEEVMLLAGAQHPVACAYVLKLGADERNHMLSLLVGICDDPVLRAAHQPGRQPLHLLPAVHFTQPARIEALPHQIVFCLRHSPL